MLDRRENSVWYATTRLESATSSTEKEGIYASGCLEKYKVDYLCLLSEAFRRLLVLFQLHYVYIRLLTYLLLCFMSRVYRYKTTCLFTLSPNLLVFLACCNHTINNFQTLRNRCRLA